MANEGDGGDATFAAFMADQEDLLLDSYWDDAVNHFGRRFARIAAIGRIRRARRRRRVAPRGAARR